MANVDHGVITPLNGPGNTKGNHIIQGWPDAANDAARAALDVLSGDLGRAVKQTDTNEWHLSVTVGTGLDKWQLIGSGTTTLDDIGANSSGILTGCVVTINGGDAATFDVSSGTAIIFDWTAGTPAVTPITFAGVTDEAVNDIATTEFTSLFINASATITQVQDANPTATQRRELVKLQQLVHPATTITLVAGGSQPSYDMAQSLLDYIIALGPVNDGNLYSAATLLTVAKSAGVTTLPFINRDNDTQNPSVLSNIAVNPVSLFYTFRDGAGGYTFVAPGVSDIDVGNFDDDSGSPTAISPATRFSIQRFHFFGQTGPAGSTTISLGQATYLTLEEAEAAIFTENPDLSPLLANAAFTTALIVQANTTDLNTAVDAKFVPITLGAVSAGGTGAVTSVTISSFANTILSANPTIGDVEISALNQEIDTTDNNTSYGDSAGNVGVHSGIANASFGSLSLSSLLGGSGDSAFGRSSLRDLTTGSDDSAFGAGSMVLLIGGSRNSAFGGQTLASVLSGNDNTAGGFDGLRMFLASGATSLGAKALDGATSGTGLLGLGAGALSAARTANAATAVGSQSFAIATGANITGVGTNAGSLTSTGFNLLLLGNDVQASSPTASDEINLYNMLFANTSSDKQMRFGGSGAVTGEAEFQFVGTSTTDAEAVLDFSNSATAVTNGADVRILVGNRDPVAFSQLDGSLYFRANDGNSTVYVNTSSTSGTTWFDLQNAKGLQSATTIVDVSAAAAPSIGQVMAATSPTTAIWTTLSIPSSAGVDTEIQLGDGSGAFKVDGTGVLKYGTVSAAKSIENDTSGSNFDSELRLTSVGGDIVILAKELASETPSITATGYTNPLTFTGPSGEGILVEGVKFTSANVSFPPVVSDSSTAAAITFDFSVEQRLETTMTEDITGITLTDPPGPCDLTLYVTNHASSPKTMTGWPAKVIWVNSTEPTLTATNSAIDMFRFSFKDPSWLGARLPNFG